MDWHDVAQICTNGHCITAYARSSPEFTQNFCKKCGAATVTSCQSCNAEIQGEYHVEGVLGFSEYKVPAFCHDCGKPYPWTKTKLKAARDLAQEMENISDEEKEILKKSIDDIVKDMPETSLAATRIKKILSKTGKPAAIAFREILVDIVSETAKKLLWPK